MLIGIQIGKDHIEIIKSKFILSIYIEEDANGDGELRRGLSHRAALSSSECVQAQPQKPGQSQLRQCNGVFPL